MITAQHLISNIQTGTPPPKKTMPGEYTTRKDISLDKLIEACRKRGADPHDVIAQALTDEAAADSERTGMNLKAQSDLAWRVLNKAEPSMMAVKHSGDPDNPIEIRRIERTIIDPANPDRSGA